MGISELNNPLRWLDVPTRITKSGDVYFGDTKVPGLIEEGGISVKPGGHRNLNRLTVTFLVGDVVAEDSQRIAKEAC